MSHHYDSVGARRLRSIERGLNGRGVRTFYGRPDGATIDVAAAVPLDIDPAALAGVPGIDIVDLPAFDAPEDSEDWVVELKCPVRAGDEACPDDGAARYSFCTGA